MRRRAAGALDALGWQPDQNEAGATYWVAKSQWDQSVAIGTPAVEPLIAALKDGVVYVRKDAAGALKQLGDARAVEPLIVALKDSAKDVRQATAEALGQLGAPGVESLIAALKDSDQDVRQRAAKVLDALGWQPDRNEAWATYWIAEPQWDQCVAIGAPAVEPLIATLKDSDEDVRKNAAKALGRLGAPTAEPPIAALKDSDKDVRQLAAWALG